MRKTPGLQDQRYEVEKKMTTQITSDVQQGQSNYLEQQNRPPLTLPQRDLGNILLLQTSTIFIFQFIQLTYRPSFFSLLNSFTSGKP
jgi:hypothetical protein